MKATIVECVMGIFGFGEANELVELRVTQPLCLRVPILLGAPAKS